MARPKHLYVISEKVVAYSDDPKVLTINQELRGKERMLHLNRDDLLTLLRAIEDHLGLPDA